MSVKPQPDSDKCGQEDTRYLSDDEIIDIADKVMDEIGEDGVCESGPQWTAIATAASDKGYATGRAERDAEVLALIDEAMRGFGTQEKADTLMALRKAIKGE